MYLILGTESCKYCNMAKRLLDNIPYRYVNLEHVYNDWRTVFPALAKWIGSQRSIPLVFKGNREYIETLDYNGLEFIGGYRDLVNDIEYSYHSGSYY